MKLRTSLQLSAIFPIVFAIVISLTLRWRMNSGDYSEQFDMIFLAFTGIVGLIMAAVILYYTKDILHKIKTLNEWTETVLKGNLEATVNIDPSDKDEVSRLSYSLSKMLREIKGAYSDIHKESAEYRQQSIEQKRIADAAQFGTKQLSDALNRLKDSQQEIMQRERLHVYEQVIRGVVHDFGEAITPIQGTVDILLTQPGKLEDKAEMAQHLQTISEAVQNARKSLRNLAGIYHVHQVRSFGPADINRLVESTVDLLKPRWKAEANAMGKSIEIRANLQAIPSVACDESDLQDAITNLLLNAIEAMSGSGTITVSTYADKTSATLEVRDTGHGMSADIKRRCLEPFYTTKGDTGTGMGLAIVNSVVYRHNGSLSIESAVNKGTGIVIKLPLWSESLREAKKPGIQTAADRKFSILLVDDEPLSLKVIGNNLQAFGHSVTCVSSGFEGLEKVRAGKFNVAIVDKAMPGMDGLTLAKAIREISPETAIVMLTGYADIMREEGDIPENIDILLSKPIPILELNRALNDVVSANE